MTVFESRQKEIDETVTVVREAFRDKPQTEGVVLCIAAAGSFIKTESDRLFDMPVITAMSIL